MFNFKNVVRAELNWNKLKTQIDLLALYKHFYNKIEYNKLVSSPFRRDRNPSFIVNYYNGELLYNDFGASSNNVGNLLQFVGRLYNIEYNKALNLIYNVAKDSNYLYDYNIRKIDSLAHKEKSPTRIRIIPKPWYANAIKYWADYNISLATLLKYDVSNCAEVIINKNGETYAKKSNNINLIFAYKLDEYYKIYLPNQKPKFLSNTTKTTIEGINQLPWLGEDLIITSSLKDTMVLDEINFPAINLTSEVINLDLEIVKVLIKLKKRFNNIYSFYDYDSVGIEASTALKDNYGIKPLYTYTSDYKDPSDFVKQYNLNELQILINSQL